jgi:hypothetical protein
MNVQACHWKNMSYGRVITSPICNMPNPLQVVLVEILKWGFGHPLYPIWFCALKFSKLVLMNLGQLWCIRTCPHISSIHTKFGLNPHNFTFECDHPTCCSWVVALWPTGSTLDSSSVLTWYIKDSSHGASHGASQPSLPCAALSTRLR